MAPIITKPVFASLLRARLHLLPKRLPRQLPPERIRERYTKSLQTMMAWVMGRVRERLLPQLEHTAADASRVATDAKDAGTIVDEIAVEFERRYGRERLKGIVTPFAEATAEFQATQLNRQLSAAISLDVAGGEPWLEKAVAEFTKENVALIKTIPARFFSEIETTITREVADGARWESLVSGIEERYSVAQSRAKLIARDQVGKFYGDLNRVRQSDLGIGRYTWRTVNDERVRDEHDALNGEVFGWGEAPDGDPGEPVLCRCFAEPLLSDLLE